MMLRSDKPWEMFDCDVCGSDFPARWIEGDDMPDCPTCWKMQQAKRDRIAEMVESGVATPSINRIHGADIAYKIAEQNGVTNMRDNQREGDIAWMPEPSRTREEENQLIRQELQRHEAMMKAPVQSQTQAVWNGQQSKPVGDVSGFVANTRQFSEEARASGADPMRFAESWSAAPQVTPGTNRHAMSTAPKVKPRMRVLSRADREGNVVKPRAR